MLKIKGAKIQPLMSFDNIFEKEMYNFSQNVLFKYIL